MTVEEVKKQVEKIRRIAEDDDAYAHQLEDKLYRDVLQVVATAGGVPAGDLTPVVAYLSDMAREALKTQEIEFSRWVE